MNIVSSIVGLAIMGTALPMVSNMMIETVVAQKRAENLAVAETSAVSYAASAQDKYTPPDVPDGCELTLIQDRTYNVTCMHGENTLRQSVTRAFTLFDEIASSLTVTTDDNLDGFDDTTGLPTHYFQCYSGWTGAGTLKNNCELGGPYVIPAYAHIYND